MMPQVAGCLLGAALLLSSPIPANAAGAEPAPLPGLHLEAGSVARQPIVAVGRGVEVAGEVTGAIERGLVAFVGAAEGDTQADLDYVVGKIAAAPVSRVAPSPIPPSRAPG